MPRRKAKSATALALPGDPLVTPDGIEVAPELDQDEAPASPSLDPKKFRPTRKRTLKELPAQVPMMNGIACVFLYSLLGVGDREIAIALKISTQELQTIRKHPAYKESFDSVLSEFISTNANLLQARIASYASKAVDNIMHIADNSKKDETRLRANIDLADRAGVTSKSEQQRNAHMSDLHIVVTKEGSDDPSVQIKIGV